MESYVPDDFLKKYHLFSEYSIACKNIIEALVIEFNALQEIDKYRIFTRGGKDPKITFSIISKQTKRNLITITPNKTKNYLSKIEVHDEMSVPNPFELKRVLRKDIPVIMKRVRVLLQNLQND